MINNLDEAIIEAERRRVSDDLKKLLPEEWIHEVGSTAIEGLIGKQDLDFLVRVPASEFNEARKTIDAALRRNPNQMSNDIYQGYVVESQLDVAVQLTVEGGPHDTFLVFLERLRGNADLRQRYNALKRKFNGQTMTEYRDAKKEFIEDVLSVS